MKTQKFFALVGIFSAFIVFQPTVAARQEHQNLTETPNFVVIGAFAIPNNAKRFTEQVNKKHLHAQFMINPNRNLYYVYVLSTIDRTEAIDEALRLRKQTEFSDTWVYNGMLGDMESGGSVQQASSRGIDFNPVTEQTIEHVQEDDRSQNATSSVNSMSGTIATVQAVESFQQNATTETHSTPGQYSSASNTESKTEVITVTSCPFFT